MAAHRQGAPAAYERQGSELVSGHQKRRAWMLDERPLGSETAPVPLGSCWRRHFRESPPGSHPGHLGHLRAAPHARRMAYVCDPLAADPAAARLDRSTHRGVLNSRQLLRQRFLTAEQVGCHR
jgi:hypothetical protein